MVITVALITACAQPNATVPTESNATIPLEVQPRDPQDPAPSAAPPTVATPVEEVSEDAPDEAPANRDAQNGDPQDSSADSDAEEPDSPLPDAAEPEISPRGQALGCVDATSLRRWIGSASPTVAQAAAGMPDQVWLCPANDAVFAELTCYSSETAAVLAALGELDKDTADLATQIATSDTTLCASGDVVRLGINDFVDPQDP